MLICLVSGEEHSDKWSLVVKMNRSVVLTRLLKNREMSDCSDRTKSSLSTRVSARSNTKINSVQHFDQHVHQTETIATPRTNLIRWEALTEIVKLMSSAT